MTLDLSQRAALLRGTIERRSTGAFRSLPLDQLPPDVEARGLAPSINEGWQLNAAASVTGVPYKVRDKYGEFEETIRSGSFRQTLAGRPDCVFRYDHEGLVLGRTTAGTLRLAEEGGALWYSVDLDPDSPTAQSLRSAIARRDVTESSFAFQAIADSWSKDFSQRTISEISLKRGDVSAVTYGASPATGLPGFATSLRGAEYRSELSTAEIDDLPDSAFAYIESGGHKDAQGKTTPRSLRHYPVHDKSHASDALARANAVLDSGDDKAKEIANKAMPKIKAAVAKFVKRSAPAAGSGTYCPDCGHHLNAHDADTGACAMNNCQCDGPDGLGDDIFDALSALSDAGDYERRVRIWQQFSEAL